MGNPATVSRPDVMLLHLDELTEGLLPAVFVFCFFCGRDSDSSARCSVKAQCGFGMFFLRLVWAQVGSLHVWLLGFSAVLYPAVGWLAGRVGWSQGTSTIGTTNGFVSE